MSFTVVVDDRCTACGACLVTCPERALLAAPKRPRPVDSLCTGCLACIEICPRDAITVADTPTPPVLVTSVPVVASPNLTRTPVEE